MKNVLISLHKGYGLGDAVMVSVILRHVALCRPEWRVDYQAEEGKHQVGRGLVANTFAYGEPHPSPYYDAEIQICLYAQFRRWVDRPNTHTATCLHDTFGLPWDAACGRYRVEVGPEVAGVAKMFTNPCHNRRQPTNSRRLVAVHYQGDSAPERKDLTHDQARLICTAIERLGCTPLLIDWRGKSPLPAEDGIRSTGVMPRILSHWGCNGRPIGGYDAGGSAEVNAAVISQCAAFVGIDSGPAKCASATDTPTLVVWVGHHPSLYHDPAPNTTHAVPCDYHSLLPVPNDPDAVRWFESHYKVRAYDSRDPVEVVATWLQEVLNERKPCTFASR